MPGRRLLYVLLAWGAIATHVLASPAGTLYVVDASPAQGAVDVPLQATIVFRFSQALGVNTSDWNTAVVEPRDAARITSVQLCVNADPCGGSGEPRFVRYVVEHQPGTDYTWLLFAARGAAGQELSGPFVLRYSTGPDLGPARISGQVNTQVLDDVVPMTVRARLAQIIELARGSTFSPSGRDIENDPHIMLTAPAATLASQVDALGSPHTRVLLLHDFTLREPDWLVRGATVLDPGSGSFEISYIREGIYWPLAVRFTDPTSTEIDAVGFLSDSSGQPSSIQVTAAGLEGMQLTLFAFPLRSAIEGLTSAREHAHRLAPDQELVMISGGYGMRPTGTAYAWKYTYRSLSTDQLATVETHALGTFSAVGPLGPPQSTMRAIPTIPVDSDYILERVLEDGGREFLDGFRPQHIQTEMTAGDLHWLSSDNQGRPFWRVTLTTVTSSRVRTMYRDVDVESGFMVSTGPLPLPDKELLVRQNYPNPFAYRTQIPVALARAAHTRIEVFDLHGRSVAVLLDAVLGPGPHEVEWAPSGHAAGPYFYRVSVDGHPPVNRKLILR